MWQTIWILSVYFVLSSPFIFFKEVRMQVIGTVTTRSCFTISLEEKAFPKALMSMMVRFQGLSAEAKEQRSFMAKTARCYILVSCQTETERSIYVTFSQWSKSPHLDDTWLNRCFLELPHALAVLWGWTDCGDSRLWGAPLLGWADVKPTAYGIFQQTLFIICWRAL